jgi:Flp pilus assembly protein TadG
MNHRRKNRAKRRGAVLVEYALLLTAFAIPAMMGIAAGGVAMMKDYQEARDTLLRPFP